MSSVDFNGIVMLAISVSILCTVFGFGLKTTLEDLAYLIRKRDLLARSLLAVLVIMPLVALLLARIFDLPPTLKIALVALAISPVPPLLPRRETKAGGHAAYGTGLLALLALCSIVTVPVSLELLERFSGIPLAMAPAEIAIAVSKSVLAPLAAGMVLRAMLPAIAKRLDKPVTWIANVLLPLAIVALLAISLPAFWPLIGNGTVAAMLLFAVLGLGIGHLLGGPEAENSVVLALSTACRHPAIAITIASSNFPDQRFGGMVLLYLIVSVLAGIPYLAWQRRHGVGALPAG